MVVLHISLLSLASIHQEFSLIPRPLAEGNVQVPVDPLVAEQGHLGHFAGLGVGKKHPPVKPVVVAEVQVHRVVFCGGLGVRKKELTAF